MTRKKCRKSAKKTRKNVPLIVATANAANVDGDISTEASIAGENIEQNVLPLPPELQLHILSFLSAKDLLAFNQVSQAAKSISECNFLWFRFYAPDKETFLLKLKMAENNKECATTLVNLIRHNENYQFCTLLLGDKVALEELYGMDIDFAITKTIEDELGYDWRIFLTSTHSFLVFKFVEKMSQHECDNVLQTLVKKPKSNIDIAIIAVTTPAEMEKYKTSFMRNNNILVLFAIPKKSLYEFDNLPKNSIILNEEHEPLSSLYARVIDLVKVLAKGNEKEEHKSSWPSCIVS